jgi:hypothetical protein
MRVIIRKDTRASRSGRTSRGLLLQVKNIFEKGLVLNKIHTFCLDFKLFHLVGAAAALAVLSSSNSTNTHCAGGSRQGEYALAQAAISFYAGVKSFRAIQSSDPRDDKQWLTFWLLYSIFELACTLSDFILGGVVPFYNELKCAFLIFLGVFGGAEKVYPLVEPFLLQGEEVANKYKQRLADLGK